MSKRGSYMADNTIDQTDKDVAFQVLDDKRDEGHNPLEVMVSLRESMGLSRSEASKIFGEWARSKR